MKKRYNILNLDCPNCARKIEENLNENERLKDVVVNFNTLKLSFNTNEDISLEEINAIVNKIEPGVKIIPESKDVTIKKEYYFSCFVVALLLGIIGLYLPLPWHFNKLLILVSLILFIYRPFINAIKMLIKSKTINENALITISCIGALLVGEKVEGLMVVALYVLGKILEEKAINNTRNSINDLLLLKQDYANLKKDNEVIRCSVEQIKAGDILIVKKGEKVPVDGKLLSTKATLDTSMLTGEQDLRESKKDDTVLSGMINNDLPFEMIATNIYEESTVYKILDLVSNATDKKAKTETLISKLSKIYTPTVLILAIITAFLLPIITNISYQESIYRGLTFLVIACPCAIAISVPLSYFTGIGTSSKNGILIKGSNYLDNLSRIDKIIFDKTGTLTTGSFEVTDINITDNTYTKDEIINMLVSGESLSNHPIAKSIMKQKTNKKNIKVTNFKELDGKGISYTIDNKQIKVGNIKICNNCKIDSDLHMNINGKHVASIYINDGIKPNAKEVIKNLKKQGIKTLMFTGDKKETALLVSKRLGLDDVKYEMLPQDKYLYYEEEEKNNITAFVGDGINDAPVLKRADIGISMGKSGSTIAIDASDVVIMLDDLSRITLGIDISKYTNHIIKQNLIFAISTKIIILLLSVFGIATMWFAVFADTGVTLITILNTLRIMHKFKRQNKNIKQL